MKYKEMCLFENYVPMSDEEKKEHGRKFVEALNKVGIKNIKEFESNAINPIENETWIVK